MKYSILIPVLMQHEYQYNLTVSCINNIHAFTKDYEIILLHSYSEYHNDIKKLLRSQDKYIAFKNNPSQAEALNMGIDNVSGDFISLIGNDNFVHQGWQEAIQKAFEVQDDYKVLGCTVDRYSPEEYEEMVKDPKNPHKIRKTNFSYLNFQGVTIPKAILEEIGKFDENLPFYFWERDYNARLDEKKILVGGVLDSFMTTPMCMTRMNKKLPRGIKNWWIDKSNTKEIDYFIKKWGRHP